MAQVYGSGFRDFLRHLKIDPEEPFHRSERVARSLLLRYGVVFRRLIDRETLAPPCSGPDSDGGGTACLTEGSQQPTGGQP